MNAEAHLRVIKAIHTLIGAFFATCVVSIPYQAWLGEFKVVLGLIALVALEVLILALNAWHCPITGIAARYTRDRRDNFDIYLPEWLARRTKIIFGALFLAGLAVSAFLWSASRP